MRRLRQRGGPAKRTQTDIAVGGIRMRITKGRTTIRSTKSGIRTTTRTKLGNTTITTTTGAGKKRKTTTTTRRGKYTFTRTT